MSAAFNPQKDENPLGGGLSSATGQKHDANHIAEKTIATIRAKLCICGGQTLHVATDGSYFVVTPWQQITRFDSLASLQAHADRGGK